MVNVLIVITVVIVNVNYGAPFGALFYKEYKMIIAVDFDGTIVENAFPNIGYLKEDKSGRCVIEKLIELKEAGNELILWTCRCGKSLDEAVSYCKKLGLEFDAVNDDLERIKEMFPDGMKWWIENLRARKVFAHVYLDDSSVDNLTDLEVKLNAASTCPVK